MLTEAHKALRREIKSIRKALKKLVRQFYDYADAQESTAPEWSDVSSVAESDIQYPKDTTPETMLDIATESDFDQHDQDEYKKMKLRNHSETESQQGIDDEVESENKRSEIQNDNGRLKTKNNFRSHRRPDSTPPVIESSYSYAKSQDFNAMKHRRQLGRSTTHFAITDNSNLPTTPPPVRSLSRNSDSPDSFSTVEDDLVLTDLDGDQLNNTYPGASPTRNVTSQNSATKSLKNFGRKNAQQQFSKTDLQDVSTSNNRAKSPRNSDLTTGDNKLSGQSPQMAEQKLSEKGVRRPIQRRFTQEEIRQAGSQLRFPRHMRRNQSNPQVHVSQIVDKKRTHSLRDFDEPPPSAPPPPPSEDNNEVMGMEDKLGAIPEFSNSFQSLPRRLSSSEISAIGGEKLSHDIPRLKKLIRNASHPITVTEVIAT